MPRVWAYCRISDDQEGAGLGVARQEADCRTLAGLRSWEVAGVGIDNDLSAYKVGVVRPAFERALVDLASGLVDGIVAYDLDRFARQPVDLERAIRIYDSRPGLVFATVQGDIDLSSPDGRTMARVLVAFANKSSMDTSRRLRRKHLELAQNGIPVGGSRPFGWNDDKRTINTPEADLIRQATRDLLSGVGQHTIVRQWNQAGVLTPRANQWKKTTFKAMLLSPRLAGYRVYQQGIARNAEGQAVKGQHEPILDVETWEKLTAVLTARKGNVGARKYLLSGLVRCGRCSSRMRGNWSTTVNKHYYVCPSTTDGGCGKCGIDGRATDKLISKLILAYLSERKVERAAQAWPREAELAEVLDRITALMKAFGDGQLDAETVFPTVNRLQAEVAALRSDQAEWLRQQVVILPTDAAETWIDLPPERQQSIAASLLQAVMISPAKMRGRFDPERVEVVWTKPATADLSGEAQTQAAS